MPQSFTPDSLEKFSYNFIFFSGPNETQAPDCVSAQISEFILREPKFPVFGLSLLKNLIWDLLSLKLNLGVPERGLVNKDVTLLC